MEVEKVLNQNFSYRLLIKIAKIISWPEDGSWIRSEMSPLINRSPDE